MGEDIGSSPVFLTRLFEPPSPRGRAEIGSGCEITETSKIGENGFANSLETFSNFQIGKMEHS